MSDASLQEFVPRRILMIKPSALGDVVTAIPVLRGLRRTFPEAHVAWLVSTNCAGLLRPDRDLDEVILFQRRKLGRCWRSAAAAGELKRLIGTLRSGRFDWVLDLQGLLRSGMLTAATRAPLRVGFASAREGAAWFYTRRIDVTGEHVVDRNVEFANRLNVDARGTDMRLDLDPQACQYVESLCRERDRKRGEFLVCVPPTRWETKLYPVRYWRRVVSAMAKRMPVVLLGAMGDEALCRQVAEGQGAAVSDLSGRTDVEQMVALIAASAGVICCDSAAKFIAPAVGVDAVVLIGPTSVKFTGPYLRGQALVADVPCQGCRKKRCRHVTCMQVIPPADVITAADEMLTGREA